MRQTLRLVLADAFNDISFSNSTFQWCKKVSFTDPLVFPLRSNTSFE
jgi:hypothetical protein